MPFENIVFAIDESMYEYAFIYETHCWITDSGAKFHFEIFAQDEIGEGSDRFEINRSILRSKS